MLDFLTWLVFAATGRIVIYLWMIFPFPPFVKMPYWLEKLHKCDLCSGFWVYSIIALALKADIISPYFGVTATIVGELITGAVTTFLVHIFTIGWHEKYQPTIVI